MQTRTGEVEDWEELKKIYGSEKEMKRAGWEPLPEDITKDEIKHLQLKPNRHERRKAISQLRKERKRNGTKT